MKLYIAHYHLRPGGIRRIIELATPCLVRELAPVEQVILLTGESADPYWLGHFTRQLGRVPVRCVVEPAFSYFSEQTLPARTIDRRIRKALKNCFQFENNALVWMHNPGIARNLLLNAALTGICAKHEIPLVAHHHDWWFDNRWVRWTEMREYGFTSLRQVATTILPQSQGLHHVTINESDAQTLRPYLSSEVGWLPNLTERGKGPSAARVRNARAWLTKKNRNDAPVWILPCRLLRRKNVAEALLLTRWLCPGGWLVTTGGVSSADEQAYANKLAAAARQHRWPLQLGILRGREQGKPSVDELVGASEAVLLTSIQEGFGLPYIEAAVANVPLIARSLPNVAPDLARFGFHFPQYYDELLIDPRLFDWRAERKRQRQLFRAWQQQLPRRCRAWAGEPPLLSVIDPEPVAFSHLTLTAQLEVLAQPPADSWKLCRSLNPFLRVWKQRAAQGKLKTTPWPAKANNWLSGPAYARHFRAIMETPARPLRVQSAVAAQIAFIRAKLAGPHLYPLLWSPET